jgi:hypothetical protein
MTSSSIETNQNEEVEDQNKVKQQELDQRLKNWYTIEEQTWSSAEELVPGSGIWVYRDVLPKELNIIERLESVISNPENDYQYQEALVGYKLKMPEYRDCVDFKYKKSDIIGDTSESGIALQKLADDTVYRQLQAVKHYSRNYNIGELRYWEATNYIRYGEGQHFQEHHDHGYSYNCVVSLVSFPNDDYEGGELYFRLQNVTIKPKAGETYIFPSNFMYPHRAMPVKSGIKYSMVTMLDYSDKFHSREFFEETGT